MQKNNNNQVDESSGGGHFCLVDQDHTCMLHHNVLASDGHIVMFIYIMHNSQLMEYARIIIADTWKSQNN